jgi:polyhydroxyalkanoate synthesis regulator phasin
MLAAGVVTTIAAASALGIGAASAQSSSGTSIVDRIATKFNLNRDEVQTVFDEQHTEMEANHEQEQSTRLQALVDKGTITADQKTALEAKHTEMEAARDALKDQNLTREEMHTKMDAARTEFETWAKDQGIDLATIRPMGGMVHGGPRGGFDGPNHDGTADDSQQ